MSVSTLLLSCIVATFWITLINGATLGVTITEVPETTAETATESLVTVAECKDKLDNCFNYGDEECVGRYAPWAHANCPYRCGYCPGNYPPCEDKITYCKELGNDACTQKIYQGFIRLNCRKTCNKCTIPALDYKPGTDNDTVVHPTDVVPSRPSEVNKPTLGQTNETASECDDKKDNCFNYDDSKCLGIYAPWAKDNCALRCGYCPGKKPPCVDNIAYCNEYSDDICTSSGYAGWARTNCRKYCNLCEVPYHGNDTINETSQTTKTFATTTSPGTAHVTPSTEHITPPHGNTGEPVRQTTTLFPVLPTGVACQDVRNDCDNYDQEACNGVFKVWAMTNCARRCGYCTNEGTPCMDYENCGHLPHTLCTAVEYRDIATTSCRKFCGLCSDADILIDTSTLLDNNTLVFKYVCNKTFAEPLPKCCNVCSCPGEEVFGRVLNQVGEPLEKAEVSFSGCDCVRYLTDSSGNYAIQDICVDGHEMFYQAAGYLASKVLPVPVVKGGKFWKADNILTLKPNVPGVNVTDAPTGR